MYIDNKGPVLQPALLTDTSTPKYSLYKFKEGQGKDVLYLKDVELAVLVEYYKTHKEHYKGFRDSEKGVSSLTAMDTTGSGGG